MAQTIHSTQTNDRKIKIYTAGTRFVSLPIEFPVFHKRSFVVIMSAGMLP